MTPQELKNSILQLAIQGKLVEQRAEEGTGKELLGKILTAKNAEGAKKNLTQRRRDAEATKESRLASNVSRPVEDAPFDIPESWEWVSLESIVNSVPSKQYQILESEVQTSGKFAVISQSKEYSIGFTDISEKVYHHVNPVIVFGDHTTEVKYVEFDFVVGADGVKIFEPLDGLLLAKYLFYVLLFNTYDLSKVGRYSRHYKFLKNKPIPLPPLAEQKRIVAKIEELLPLIDRYEKAWSRLEDFNKRFPVDMQKSLLQMAIQGKLVEQRPEEGTAAELLEKILAAKNAEGTKGRGEKSHAKSAKSAKVGSRVLREEIPDDEKPFDIPESWEWVRLEDLVIKDIKRGKSPTYTQKSGTLVFAQKCNAKAGVINLSLALFLDEAKLSKYPESEFMRDCDIVINSTGNGTLGRVGIYRDSDNPNKLPVVPDSHVTVIRVGEKVSVEYVFYGLKHYQPLLEKLCSGSTNQTELSASTVKSLLFPLPPLAEQKRIVAKLEELLPLCERLK